MTAGEFMRKLKNAIHAQGYNSSELYILDVTTTASGFTIDSVNKDNEPVVLYIEKDKI